jgi:hypothetical protein
MMIFSLLLILTQLQLSLAAKWQRNHPKDKVLLFGNKKWFEPDLKKGGLSLHILIINYHKLYGKSKP